MKGRGCGEREEGPALSAGDNGGRFGERAAHSVVPMSPRHPQRSRQDQHLLEGDKRDFIQFQRLQLGGSVRAVPFYSVRQREDREVVWLDCRAY